MESELGEILSLKQRVYDNLRTRIIKGELAPGERLLEADLSESMAISRAPIREAFNMLERDGFTKIIPRKGAVVAEITEEDIYDIWEMRLLMEPYAAKLTALLITDEEIKAISADMLYVQSNPTDFDRYVNLDLELHDLLCKNLENRYLKSTLDNIRAHSLRVRWADEYDEDGKCIQETAPAVNYEHGEIVRALQKRDTDLVFQAVYQHVLNSMHRIIRACNEHPRKET